MTKGRISSDFPGKTEKNREKRRENLAKINSGDVPQVTELADELKAAGMEIPCGILTIDELVAALEPLLKRKEA